jgi:hypothetical protein
MSYTIQNSYSASFYWRWRAYYNLTLRLFYQLMPARERHDTFKTISKLS